MTYHHLDIKGQPIDLPNGKVVCVGRNYVEHVKELGNEVPTEPLLFIKPATALCHVHHPLLIPKDKGPCHNELEIAVLIKKKLKSATSEHAKAAIWGIGLGLDLTLREVQNTLRSKGLPWERAKAFDASCPVSAFVPMQEQLNLQDLAFALHVNGLPRQSGNSTLMIWDVVSLLVNISETFTLQPGDIVMTGTPKGVGSLESGDQLKLTLSPFLHVDTTVG